MSPIRACLMGPLLLAVMGCKGPMLAPTPIMYLGSDDNPFESVPAVHQSNTVDVMYGTDRQDEDESELEDYGFKRSHSLLVGSCTVEFGSDVPWDALVADSRTDKRSQAYPLKLTEVDELLQFPRSSTPPEMMGAVLEEDPLLVAGNTAATDQVSNMLSARLAHTDRKEVFLYVHGYNNTFELAAFRTAQLWHFMGRVGVPVMYSWPAGHGGALRGYNYDRESGEFTVFHLKQFIKALASCPELEKIHMVAHSRGTDVLTSALRELYLEYRHQTPAGRERFKLGHLVLAAPDLDFDVAQQRLGAERVLMVIERMTIYLSEEDRALGMADWLFDSLRRIGRLRESDLTPEQEAAFDAMPIVEWVDVRARTSFLGHAYFMENPAVLSDLILALRDELPAGAEHGRPLVNRRGGFWDLPEGYPNVEPDGPQ